MRRPRWLRVESALLDRLLELVPPGLRFRAKTATRRTIPVYSKDLRKVLLRRRLRPDRGRPLPGDNYVFGNEVGERVGADGLNFHDLRRECASRWFKGVRPDRKGRMPLPTVSRLLAHTSIETTFICLGVAEETLPEDVQRFEEARANLAKPSDSDRPDSVSNLLSVH